MFQQMMQATFSTSSKPAQPSRPIVQATTSIVSSSPHPLQRQMFLTLDSGILNLTFPRETRLASDFWRYRRAMPSHWEVEVLIVSVERLTCSCACLVASSYAAVFCMCWPSHFVWSPTELTIMCMQS